MGTRSLAVLQFGPAPKNQEKCFNKFFFIFLCGHGVRRQGVCCPTSKLKIIELKPDALLKVSWEKPRLQASKSIVSTQAFNPQAQGSVIRIQESIHRSWGLDHTNRATLQAPRLSLQGQTLPGHQNTNSQIAFWPHWWHSTFHIEVY